MRSTTARRGLSDVYSRMMRWSTTPKAQPAAEGKLFDPTKNTATTEDMPEEGRPRRLRVLGKPRDKSADLAWVRENFSFEAWPTRKCRVLATSDVEAALTGAKFDTLSDKLATSKAVSKALGIAVPDFVLNKNLAGLKEYLLSASRRYDEKLPDAVYLEGDFGANVVLEPTAEERRALAKRNKKLVHEARIERTKQVQGLLNI